ncbi:putative reverse transcriptase domain-containing protein [Tanacetum coccineum]
MLGVTKMVKVVSKMKLLKKPLRMLLTRPEQVFMKGVNQLRINLTRFKRPVDSNPDDPFLREEAYSEGDHHTFLALIPKVSTPLEELKSGGVVINQRRIYLGAPYLGITFFLNSKKLNAMVIIREKDSDFTILWLNGLWLVLHLLPSRGVSMAIFMDTLKGKRGLRQIILGCALDEFKESSGLVPRELRLRVPWGFRYSSLKGGGKAKGSWDEICSFQNVKEGLVGAWSSMFKLGGRSFWDIPIKNDMSWGWRKLLQLREIVKPFFWVTLGNGLFTSVWYDRWVAACPLITFLSPRDITREGFHLKNVVADLIVNGAWAWPHSWLHKAPDLGLIAAPALDVSQHDIRQWRDRNGNLSQFSVAKAWEAIRPRSNQVNWSRLVWFSHNIPRHAFHLWLVMRNGLKTHDRMRQWDVGPNVDLNTLRCTLCDAKQDSHSHLFFECTFSSTV